MSVQLNNPFVGGVSLCIPITNGRSNVNFGVPEKRRQHRRRRVWRCKCGNGEPWVSRAVRFSHFFRENVELIKKNIGSRGGLIANCVKGPLNRSKSLVVKSLGPQWHEGLLLFRSSVFVAVISGVCFSLWYGQTKAKGFIEAQILPSVCSTLSEYIQRDIICGKVRGISPLSITLESCSFGPHVEEFSCGEASTIKLCLRPFSSLRRGKIVIDAVLLHPSVLVVQKRDYTWLGIPSTEGFVPRHLSSEEGIDHRTRTRRIAREEAATRWSKQRDNSAREAAEFGYVLSEKGIRPSKDDDFKDRENPSTSKNSAGYDSSPSIDELVQFRDHRCMDTRANYDIKHAELEKSFGVKLNGSEKKLWSRRKKGPGKHKLKRKAAGIEFYEDNATVKRRILNRSSAAAASYFQSLPLGILYESPVITGDSSSALRLNEENSTTDSSGNTVIGPAELVNKDNDYPDGNLNIVSDPFLSVSGGLEESGKFIRNPSSESLMEKVNAGDGNAEANMEGLNIPKSQKGNDLHESDPNEANSSFSIDRLVRQNAKFLTLYENMGRQLLGSFSGSLKKLKSTIAPKVEEVVEELVEGTELLPTEGIGKVLPVTLDSVYFRDGSLMILGYGDNEPREMENANGRVRFQKNYGLIHVQLDGNCQMWRSDNTSDDGGWLSVDVFVDNIEQKWHANLKTSRLFAPLFERIVDIPISWFKGRATGEVHLCMSGEESFPNIYGQLDVAGLAFEIYDAPSRFLDVTASLCFRGQRIFLQNASGWFGSVPLEASGDFGINPDDGEYHVMCQVPSVEVNDLMKTFRMRPLIFPLAGSITAVFNCQGPLDVPVFVGSGIVSRKIVSSLSEPPVSAAYDAMMRNKEAGAVAAFDRVPFSYLSANFTFNSDNCVADLYGIRASLVDGGEIRGAGNAWICPEGELDDSAMDMNFSGNLCFDNILKRYMADHLQSMSPKLGDLTGETKLSGSLMKPRFDIKWTAPKAEGSFNDARGDIIISHDYITVNSSSADFDLHWKILTSYPEDYWLDKSDVKVLRSIPFTFEGLELDLRMRGFEFLSSVSSYPFDSPRPVHLKATGRIRFHGEVIEANLPDNQPIRVDAVPDLVAAAAESTRSLVGDVSISGLKLNQLTLAPQLAGPLKISKEYIKLEAMGRPDESLAVEVAGPLGLVEGNETNGRLLSFSLQKGQLRANVCYQPRLSATLELRNLPLDEMELASLRGMIQRAEIQLNLQKRRGHGNLSVLRPKFSGVLGEALDVAARWSGDVITVEKTILEQSSSRYELQGEYVLPGSRDRNQTGGESGGLLQRALTGHLGSVISSMGRWRMRLEVPQAEVAEMLPLARLLSRSTDPAVHSRSKEFFIRNLQSVGLDTESLQELLEVIRGHYMYMDEIIPEDLTFPGLSEFKGQWHGSFDASGGGNGDTQAEFDFHGEDWEWGAYKTQRVLAVGAYSNDDGLRLDNFFIQKDNATIHADGTLSGLKTNLHFAVLNFPVSLVPTVLHVIESSARDAIHSLHHLLAPIKGILHMEGDLRGSLARPECDVQVRLLDGAIGGIDLGRAEIVASLTSASRFLFNAKLEPVIQSGHVHIQGSVPLNFSANNVEEGNNETDRRGSSWTSAWSKESPRVTLEETGEKKVARGRNEEAWDAQLAEGLKGLNWNVLDVGEVRVDADVKDGGMMLLTALSPYANWLHGNADIVLQVRGTVEQPVFDGSASFHRASLYSPVLRKPLTNLGGTLHVQSNRLCISSLESKFSRRGKLFVKGNLPFKTTDELPGDRIDLKCEMLEVRAKNVLSGQVDSQLQISGSIFQPNISGDIKLSQGEAYLPHDKGSGAPPFEKLPSRQSRLRVGGVNRMVPSRYISRFFGLKLAASQIGSSGPSVKSAEVDKETDLVNFKPEVDIRLSDLKLILGPELRIVYPLILNFAVSGELELNGLAHPKLIMPKGILTFENGDVNLVATQVRLNREHLNIAKFEPEHGLDPLLDLALVGSEWQFRIQSRASNWQDNLVVTTTRTVEQDVLSPTEAARVFESQLAESILEGDGQLAFKKLATATLETLMPRIEGKGEFGQARWRVVYAPQIPSLLSVDPTVDPFKSLASNISFGTEVEVRLGKRLQASIVRQMKDSEMAMQWTLIYQLTSRLRVLLQSAPSKRLLFEYSAISQD
ncbi:hypothetical protein MLD38_013947 [Melastoma candidum]|uniref:Uncharacterized protein n=1 Tax=Melastoma candidum TaxID=119954 RepID=A0ACB9RCI9_9MYRT|nr:hypothetical protein MLD38_013947 [Melastoma candidum]